MKRFLRILLLLIFTVWATWWLAKRGMERDAARAELSAKAVETFTPELKPAVSAADVPLLQQINREYVRVSQAVIPSVVNVIASRPASPQLDFGEGTPFVLPFPLNPAPNNPSTPDRPGKRSARLPRRRNPPSAPA